MLKAIDDDKVNPHPLAEVNPHPQVEVNPHPGSELKYGERMPIPENIRYVKIKFKTGCGKIRMLVGFDENNNPIEIYNVVSSSGGCMMNIQGLAIAISEFLRRGGKIEDLYENAQEAGNCPSYMYRRGQGHNELYGKSCFHGMIKAIMEYQSGKISDNLIVQGGGYITQAAPQKIEVQVKLPKNKQCPSCGNTLVAETGCLQCKNCGFSVCE